MTHPRLRHLAKSLPAIPIQDRAPKTMSTYVRAYEAWQTWAVQCEATPLPVDPAVFSLYLVHLIQQDQSVSSINSAIYGASWVHKKSGCQQVSDHPLVQQVAEAARRILARPPNRQRPLEVSQVKSAIRCLEQGPLSDIQVAALFAFIFFGFLCWDDLSRLTVDNLQFEDSHLAILLTQRKNDQFRQGSWVFVARSDSSPCPVAVVENFLRVGNHERKSRLFRRVLSTKNGMKLRKDPMSYSWAAELIKVELRREGLDPALYGIHSLRAGGATAERLFQRQGDWRSDRAWNSYIEESLDSLLLVTRTLQDQTS